MSSGEEPSLREQLIDARGKITAQLRKMYNPLSGSSGVYAPDFRQQIAELESELREIDELLESHEEP